MGCGISRSNDSQLLTLCRDRKSLIRAAADRRFAMASAYSDYLRSLPLVADAIHDFVVQELSVVTSSPPPPPSDRKPSLSPSSSSVSPISHSVSPDSERHLPHVRNSSESESVKESLKDSESRTSRSPNYGYMRSSTGFPTMIYQNPYSWGDFGNYPMNSPVDEGFTARSRDPTAEIAPPPPEGGGAEWDFINPFNSYEQLWGNYSYSPEKYYNVGSGSGSGSTNSSEVRAREGIPDLEDEREEEILKAEAARKGKKVMDEGLTMRDFGEGMSKSMEKEGEGNGESSKENNSIEEEKEEVLDRKASSDQGVSVGPSNRNVSLDIVEVVKEIKKLFMTAANCGEEVSRMLEVGRVNYRSRSRMWRVVSSRILEPMGFSTLRRPFRRSQTSTERALKNRSSPAAFGNRFGMKSGSLSSTLEKLYVWERKLYKEVQAEEKLRVIYERMCRRLRHLDNHGEESQKIDSTRAALRRLQMKLSIVIRSADAISRRMHRIRDKELQPQLDELVRGLTRMWKSMLECHQKQFQAIVYCKSNNIMAKTGSNTKIFRELEVQLINWYSTFYDWIKTQKSFVEALNGWLIKWLPLELEETPDGVAPFSPGRIEAPAVFIISNDWDNALGRVSEAQIIEAVHNFALNAHILWESREKEQQHKQKAESLSRAYSRRLGVLQNDHRMQEDLDIVSINDNNRVYAGDQQLELIKRRMDEERAKREEILKLIQGIASSSVCSGFLPIFEALANFTLETAKAYEGIRI